MFLLLLRYMHLRHGGQNAHTASFMLSHRSAVARIGLQRGGIPREAETPSENSLCGSLERNLRRHLWNEENTLTPHHNKVASRTKISSLYLYIRYKGIFLAIYLVQDLLNSFVITDISLYPGSLYQGLSVFAFSHVHMHL